MESTRLRMLLLLGRVALCSLLRYRPSQTAGKCIEAHDATIDGVQNPLLKAGHAPDGDSPAWLHAERRACEALHSASRPKFTVPRLPITRHLAIRTFPRRRDMKTAPSHSFAGQFAGR